MFRGSFTVAVVLLVVYPILGKAEVESKWLIPRSHLLSKRQETGPVVMLRRQDGSVDFDRPWSDYKEGFGDRDGEFWFGLDRIHQITFDNYCGINVTITSWDGHSFWAYYSDFSVGPESSNYRLYVSGYDSSSTAGDSLSYNDGMPFSTKDRDNDADQDSCSPYFKGGWWFKSCTDTNPTGRYTPGGVRTAKGLTWWLVPGYNIFYSFKAMTFTLIPQ